MQTAVATEAFAVINACRVCGCPKLISVLSLGAHAVSDFVTDEQQKNVRQCPLELVLCDPEKGCSLLQLKHTVDPRVMFHNYWYKSGVNETMINALRDITLKLEATVQLESKDVVVDIGANDGTLLRSYSNKELNRVGFEPAKNLVAEAASGGACVIVNDFFNRQAFVNTVGVEVKARLVTSIAMFYAVNNPNAFVTDVKQILAEDGVWVIQMAYLPSMLETNNFDNICHEHVTYYSMKSLESLLARHGIQVFDVELNDVNGGSFRVYAQHASCKRQVSGGDLRMKALREKESRLRLDDRSIYEQFAQRVQTIRRAVVDFVRAAKESGKRVHVYGASTKGNTLLQFFELDGTLIEAAADRNPDKWGLKTVTTGIPVISEAESRKRRPNYYLVLPWHFREEFVRREEDFLRRGGKMIFPLPTFEVV